MGIHSIYGHIFAVLMFFYGPVYFLFFSAQKICYICLIAGTTISMSHLAIKQKMLNLAAWIIFLSVLFVIFGASFYVYGLKSPILFWLVVMPQVGTHLGIPVRKTLSTIVLGLLIFCIIATKVTFIPELTEQNTTIASIAALLGVGIVNFLFKQIYERNLLANNKDLKATNDELIKTRHQLIEKEKLSIVGIISAGISHEFNNSLNSMGQGIRALRSSLQRKDEGSVNSLMDDMEETVRLSADLIKSIKKLNKIEDEKKTVELRAFVNTICNLYKGLSFEDFFISNNIKEGFTADVNELALYSALANVIKNAIEASKDVTDKRISIEASQNEKKQFIIDVSDFGQGVPQSSVDVIFEGVSSKEDGMGYGLKHAREKLRMTGGDLELINLKNPTIFRITMGT